MELTMTEKAHLVTISRYLRIAAVTIVATAGILAGQAYLGIGELLAGWMASAQPVFMTLGVSRAMANPGFATGMKIIVSRLARAMFY